MTSPIVPSNNSWIFLPDQNGKITLAHRLQLRIGPLPNGGSFTLTSQTTMASGLCCKFSQKLIHQLLLKDQEKDQLIAALRQKVWVQEQEIARLKDELTRRSPFLVSSPPSSAGVYSCLGND